MNNKYIKDDLLLCKEWDYEKNKHLEFAKVLAHSNKKAWWICSSCGHKWYASITNRSNGCGCPICSKKKAGIEIMNAAIKKSGSLADKYPDLISEWDYSKNTTIPTNYSCGSNKRVWWICPRGHSYQSSVINRVQGSGCPYCSGRKVLAGYNDLLTLYPSAREIWDYSRNDIQPEEISSKSHKYVWWKCSKGHSWQAKVSHITDGHGCPYCAGQRAIAGVNDISTTNPSLAKEWDFEKNHVSITDVMESSGKKYWWKCSKGHSWQATAAHRSRGEGCPICASILRTSLPEKVIFYYVHNIYLDAVGSYRSPEISPYELDIYIPSKKIAVEYDGEYYHNNTEKDKAKDQLCASLGIRLIRIREPKCPLYISHSEKIVLHSLTNQSLEHAIDQLLNSIDSSSNNHDINVERDTRAIDSLREYQEITNSFGENFPSLVAEWNYNKNGSLTPYQVSKFSGRKVWWICNQCGHEWQSIIANRAKGSGCPVCASRNASKRALLREARKKEKNSGSD